MGIPPRDPQTQPNLIDLSRFYNVALNEDLQESAGNNLAALPRGVQMVAQVQFDLRGVIHLSSTELVKMRRKRYAPSVTGLPVNRKATRLLVLHGTAYTEPAGTPIGAYRLHYADGQQAELPIVYGEDVRDWWCFRPEDTNATTHATLAWTGENPSIKRRTGGFLRLYLRTYENPRPDVEIKTIDFVSTMTKCAPFLIALTVE